jgi:hypothetical protein
MVEVATLFLDYFKDWKYEKNGFKIDYIVSLHQRTSSSRAASRGAFAAFTPLASSIPYSATSTSATRATT